MTKLISNAYIESGRLKPQSLQNKPNIDRGIAIHNRIGKFFANIFGSGTIKAEINGKKYYLNKGSCYKFLNVSKKNAPKSDKELIQAINAVFERRLSKSDSTSQTINSSPQKKPLDDIYSDVKDRVEGVNEARNKLLAQFDGISEEEFDPKLTIMKEYAERKKETQAANERCQEYLDQNPLSIANPKSLAALLEKSTCIKDQRPDDSNYATLKEDLENKLKLQMQLFSKLYDSIDKSQITFDLRLLIIELRDFYPSRDEGLSVLKENCSPEAFSALADKWPIPTVRKPLSQIVKEIEEQK